MGASFLTSLLEFQLMGANYLLSPVFSENQWVHIDLSQTQWVQLHPLTHPNDTPGFAMKTPACIFRAKIMCDKNTSEWLSQLLQTKNSC